MEAKIFPAMAAIMKEVEAIKKDKENKEGFRFKYRGIDDVMNSLHESFAKNGVFITTEVLDRKEVERTSGANKALFYVTITVRFTFNASDGSFISSTIYGTAMDSGDKADNKCMSIALKYCLLQSFLIPTEDMVDPDSQTHEVKPITNQPKSIPPPPAPPKDRVQADGGSVTPPPRPAGTVQITPAAFEKAVARMNLGELGVPAKIRKAYMLTSEQDKTLKLFEEKESQIKEPII